MEAKKQFNKYGTCIDCQGGKEECLHNNQAVVGRKQICNTCGIVICDLDLQ